MKRQGMPSSPPLHSLSSGEDGFSGMETERGGLGVWVVRVRGLWLREGGRAGSLY